MLLARGRLIRAPSASPGGLKGVVDRETLSAGLELVPGNALLVQGSVAPLVTQVTISDYNKPVEPKAEPHGHGHAFTAVVAAGDLVAAGDHEIVASDDLVVVAELAGHRRLETTRRYSLPSRADRQKAGGPPARLLMPVDILTASQRMEWERFLRRDRRAALTAYFSFADDELEAITGIAGLVGASRSRSAHYGSGGAPSAPTTRRSPGSRRSCTPTSTPPAATASIAPRRPPQTAPVGKRTVAVAT
ncbi:MAG: hypothetical protein QOI48_879 [Solirubrobacteraceae bacterium]|jgi:hypothetical protein|nr:hypothetical protein [Solirubrobacteraceae bacterium]